MPRRPDPKVEAIVEARHGDPFSFLGMHPTPGGVCVRAMLPAAQEMAVIDSATGKVAAKGVRVHPDGFFVANVADRKEPFRYRLRISRGASNRSSTTSIAFRRFSVNWTPISSPKATISRATASSARIP